YFKDNLLNALLHREGLPLSDGCTGYGCGAAFNFIALLPDGEAAPAPGADGAGAASLAPGPVPPGRRRFVDRLEALGVDVA
ncbi:hypothetical protein G3N55_13020, partial [Dissulfurirhabdus thermomarina]|nr:hypothetical protein [Dissulfurirhabdus thermomarina]